MPSPVKLVMVTVMFATKPGWTMRVGGEAVSTKSGFAVAVAA